MVTGRATVKNEFGIHCRPAAIIAQEAKRLDTAIRICTEHGEANAKSVLELVGLAISCGVTVEILVEGGDEEEICEQFVELFETRFDFDRQPD